MVPSFTTRGYWNSHSMTSFTVTSICIRIYTRIRTSFSPTCTISNADNILDIKLFKYLLLFCICYQIRSKLVHSSGCLTLSVSECRWFPVFKIIMANRINSTVTNKPLYYVGQLNVSVSNIGYRWFSIPSVCYTEVYSSVWHMWQHLVYRGSYLVRLKKD